MKQSNNKTIKILVFGTFDILHKGHLNFFKQARRYGNKLIVVIGRDKNIKLVKKQKPLHSEKERLENVKSLPMVDRVVLGYIKDKYLIIKKIRPDIICLGYDQNSYTKNLRKKLKELEIIPKIVRLKPFHPEKYKSSLLKRK